jgi:hypothetical protein
MDFNFKLFEFDKPQPNVSENFGPRLGVTSTAYNISFNSSKYHDVCWWTLEAQSASIPENDTTFAYSEITCYIAGAVFAVQSVIGTILNFLLIVALLRNPKLRKEYLTKTILSIVVTDFLWCVYFLPLMSHHYFTG